MTAIMFDTHEFIKELKGAGFSEEQAEIITKLQKSAIAATLEQAKHDYDLDDLATKRDLKELETGLKRDIKELELKQDAKLAETKRELIRWIVSVGLLPTALISALLIKLSALG